LWERPSSGASMGFTLLGESFCPAYNLEKLLI